MKQILFNPFEDRTDRDVRNLLGSAFMCALEKQDFAPVTQAVLCLEKKELSGPALNFIKTHLKLYAAVLAKVSNDPRLKADIYAVADLLWGESLFFECHEWLEQGYRHLKGHQKKIRQAMIRTAGAFELLGYGRIKPAVSVAAKALAVLEPNMPQVPGAFNVGAKMDRLKSVLDEYG